MRPSFCIYGYHKLQCVHSIHHLENFNIRFHTKTISWGRRHVSSYKQSSVFTTQNSNIIIKFSSSWKSVLTVHGLTQCILIYFFIHEIEVVTQTRGGQPAAQMSQVAQAAPVWDTAADWGGDRQQSSRLGKGRIPVELGQGVGLNCGMPTKETDPSSGLNC